jgi:phage terminase large subunit
VITSKALKEVLRNGLELEVELSDKQLECEASLNRVDVTGYGGAKGGGKSAGARLISAIDLGTPGCVTGLFRRSYPELEDNHIGPLFKSYPFLRDYYNSQKKAIRIPDIESELKFRYCKNYDDVSKQAGREYHKLKIEEAGDWPYEMWMGLIRNTNRCSIAGIKASTGLFFNWGGIGHAALKRIFWNKDLRDNEKDLSWNFILAKVEDNPKLMEYDPGYLLRLESEPNEALRRAYRHGDPNIVAGQFFTQLSRSIHVVPPFKIPSYWKWFGSYDYGFNHPACWQFFVADTDGNIYLVKEIMGSQLGIYEQAKLVHAFIDEMMDTKQMEKRMNLFFAGHDCWAKKKGTEPTIAEDFASSKVVDKYTIHLKRANIDRKQGAKQIRNYLYYRIEKEDDKLRRIGPRLHFFENCDKTFDCVGRMVHNPDDIEDVLKIDASEGDVYSGDDPYDTLRYGLMSRPPISIEPKRPKGTTYDSYDEEKPTSWMTA